MLCFLAERHLPSVVCFPAVSPVSGLPFPPLTLCFPIHSNSQTCVYTVFYFLWRPQLSLRRPVRLPPGLPAFASASRAYHRSTNQCAMLLSMLPRVLFCRRPACGSWPRTARQNPVFLRRTNQFATLLPRPPPVQLSTSHARGVEDQHHRLRHHHKPRLPWECVDLRTPHPSVIPPVLSK